MTRLESFDLVVPEAQETSGGLRAVKRKTWVSKEGPAPRLKPEGVRRGGILNVA